MPTIANLPGADLPVTFPSGETRTVNMIVLLAETQHAEMMTRFGHGLAPNAPTIAGLRAKYDLDYFYDAPVRTWQTCAATMRHIHTVFSEHIASA